MTNQPSPEARFFATLDSAVLYAQERSGRKAFQALELARGMDYLSDDLSRAHWKLCAAKLGTAFHHPNGRDLSAELP